MSEPGDLLWQLARPRDGRGHKKDRRKYGNGPVLGGPRGRTVHLREERATPTEREERYGVLN